MRETGPTSFPELIICGSSAIFKMNGMPFAAPLREDGYWPFLASTSYDALVLLLEFLWTRLTYELGVPGTIFGEDLSLQAGNVLLMGRCLKWKDQIGWEYEWVPASRKKLAITGCRLWEPAELTLEEYVIVNQLCNDRPVVRNDPSVVELLKGGRQTFDSVAASLRTMGIATVEDGRLELLTDSCACVTMPDGKFYAAENKSGRLGRWVKRQMAMSSQRPPETPKGSHARPHDLRGPA